mmetsp:Transcript_32771/g.104469  ORF Transcript_32771/g.104469 Transcript_32771/m.104469 type:complete len:223 (-) Transcript_32771:948-1616(-)
MFGGIGSVESLVRVGGLRGFCFPPTTRARAVAAVVVVKFLLVVVVLQKAVVPAEVLGDTTGPSGGPVRVEDAKGEPAAARAASAEDEVDGDAEEGEDTGEEPDEGPLDEGDEAEEDRCRGAEEDESLRGEAREAGVPPYEGDEGDELELHGDDVQEIFRGDDGFVGQGMEGEDAEGGQKDGDRGRFRRGMRITEDLGEEAPFGHAHDLIGVRRHFRHEEADV